MHGLYILVEFTFQMVVRTLYTQKQIEPWWVEVCARAKYNLVDADDALYWHLVAWLILRSKHRAHEDLQHRCEYLVNTDIFDGLVSQYSY